MDFKAKLNNHIDSIETALAHYLKNDDKDIEPIFEAMRYSLLGGGKRIRAILALEFCKMCGGNENAAIASACAIEMIHAYSLIHDDMPCMDNDDYRRGKLTNHKKFGEGMALLAGDGLLTKAFEILSCSDMPAENKMKSVKCLSLAAGEYGMIGGQVIDFLSENKKVAPDLLNKMHLLKTGALIKASCILGCIAASADEKAIDFAEKFGTYLGLAFQIQDDILDVTGDFLKLGKNINSDEKSNKNTYVTLYGVENAISMQKEYSNKALECLKYFKNSDFVVKLTQMLIDREN